MTNRNRFMPALLSTTLLTFAAAIPSLAQTNDDTRYRMSDIESGSLLLRTDKAGEFLKAPMVKTDVDFDISGPIIRATVSQIFTNDTDDWVEGVYVFPLPDMAAVDHLKMVIGGRLIEGQIEEKQKAKAIYEKAKSEGRKASLLTQERPNVFTNSVANIGPGESVAIQIEYQDVAKMEDGIFSMRFPMTVGPRYSPPRETVQIASRDGNVSMAILDPVLDRDRISPPLMPPVLEPIEYTRLPVTIDVDLAAGFPIDTLDSPYHAISTVNMENGSKFISLRDGEVPANRDFLLEWTAQPSEQPYTSVFHQNIRGEDFVMTMITPSIPEDLKETISHPREIAFVIDTSGSMGGTSIEQARKALLLGLERLGPKDYFNVIEFNNAHSTLFPAPRTANKANLNKAQRWVRRLNAGGGTNMAPAMNEALSKMRRNPGYLGQVVFITDGNIGNEGQLFAIVKDQLQDTRLFPVSIGSAPNNFFMSRAAKFGRGKFVNIADIGEVEKRMDGLFQDIDSAILTSLQITGLDTSDTYPSKLPDLYDGEPVVTVAKVSSVPTSMGVTGRLADADWNMMVDGLTISEGAGLDVLWARRKIADLEESRFDRSKAAQIDKNILETALKYHLVSRLTSLVAVDVTPSRPVGEGLSTQAVPTMLPDGWDFATLSGVPSANATTRSPAATPSQSPSRTLQVPRTASPHNFLMLIGGMMLAFSAVLRRRFGRQNAV